MAQLSYDGVSMGVVTRTLNFHNEAVLDPSGLDLLCFKHEIECLTVISPADLVTVLSSNTGQPAFAQPGDRLGVAMRALIERLNTPRRQLILTVGPDVVYTAILALPAPGGGSTGIASDANFGPTTRARLTEITGDKAARFHFTATFYTRTTDSNVVLSNRYSVRTSTAADGRSTRRVEGLLIVRPDTMSLQGLHIDQFRAFAILPCPDTFIRTGGDVEVDETGCKLSYWVTDSENILQLGSDGQGCNVVSVRGNATAGVDVPLRTIGGKVASALGGGDVLKPFNFTPRFITDAIIPYLPAILPHVPLVGDAFPVAKANIVVRVTGQPDSPKSAMITLAKNVILDRFNPLVVRGVGGITGFPILSTYITQSLAQDEENWVEIRTEILPLSNDALRVILDPSQPQLLMNLDTAMTTNGLSMTRKGTNTTWQTGFNTRGSYTANLLAQVLGLPGALPTPIPQETATVPGTTKFPEQNFK